MTRRESKNFSAADPTSNEVGFHRFLNLNKIQKYFCRGILMIHDCSCRGRLGRGSNNLGRGSNDLGGGSHDFGRGMLKYKLSNP